jgi:hypothetical protein
MRGRKRFIVLFQDRRRGSTVVSLDQLSPYDGRKIEQPLVDEVNTRVLDIVET